MKCECSSHLAAAKRVRRRHTAQHRRAGVAPPAALRLSAHALCVGVGVSVCCVCVHARVRVRFRVRLRVHVYICTTLHSTLAQALQLVHASMYQHTNFLCMSVHSSACIYKTRCTKQ